MKKAPKWTQGLVKFFEEIEATDYRLSQGSGGGPSAARRYTDQDGEAVTLTSKELAAAKRISSLCGKCFGAHLADWFKTNAGETRHSRSAVINLIAGYTTYGQVADEFGIDRVDWPFRSYIAGINALFNRLMRLPKDSHFKEWLYNEFEFQSDAYREDAFYGHFIVQHYLHYKCGAPPDCFGYDKWPKNTKPSIVLNVMLQRNYQM